MARIETWFDQDLKKAVKVQYIDGNVFSQDNSGNVVGVNVYDNGEPATLGGSVSANIIRADGVTIAAVGVLSGNQASVVLPPDAYIVPGVISVVIKLTSGTDVTTLCAVVGNVYQSTTDSIVDPGTIIPSIETLIAEIEAAVASIPADYSDLWETLAPAFSSSVSYSEGQYVTYDGSLYRFNKPHSGTWSASDAIAVNIGGEIFSLHGTMNNVFRTQPIDIISLRSVFVPYDSGTLSCVYDSVNGEYVLNGTTSSATTFFNIISERPLPSAFIKNGETYNIFCNLYDGNFYVECFQMRNGSIISSETIIGNMQITIGSDIDQLIIRLRASSNKTFTNARIKISMQSVNANGAYKLTSNSLPANTDINSITESGIYVLASGRTYVNHPFGNDAAAILYVFSTGFSIKTQIAFMYNYTDNKAVMRSALGSTWNDWIPFGLGPKNNTQEYANLSDANSLFGPKCAGYYLKTDSKIVENLPVPSNAPAWLLCIPMTAGWTLQVCIDWDTEHIYFRRNTTVSSSSTWSQWKTISGGQTINNYTFNEYQNTYNVTATPTITTDTNAYLAPTGDTTDRTAEIATMLSTYGVCRLGKGDYYVNNLQMPINTSIIGCGNPSRIILSGSSDGFAVKMNSSCHVSQVAIYGGLSAPTLSSIVGGRHGILWQGTYTQDQQAPTEAMIDNVYIRNFTGGGITCYDTGYGTHNALIVSNADIVLCGAGINVSYWSEFNKFTNVRTMSCYYGCINNGGNNVFTNCDFSGCTLAMLMDNSQDQSPNNTHGSCVGCVFNHSGDNTGIGVQILNCHSGFMFIGCQIFFSKIALVDSDGVVFSGTNFGYNNCDVSISGGGAITFTNCMTNGAIPISITNNSNVHFTNCYVRATGVEWKP